MLATRKTKQRKNRRKTDARRLWQKRRQRAARAIRLLVGLALIPVLGLALIFGHDLLTQCDFFRIKEVAVTGNHHIADTRLCQQARVAPGMNLLAVNLGLVRKRLLAQPWIAEVSVRREFPNRLFIRVQEHHPLAVLQLDRSLLLDTAGQIFKIADTGETQGLPRIDGLGYGDLPVGSSQGSPALAAALTLLGAGQTLPGAMGKAIRRIRIDRETGLTFWGPPSAGAVIVGHGIYREKLHRLATVMDHLKERFPGQKMDRIDLTDINRIVVAPPTGEPTAEDQKEV